MKELHPVRIEKLVPGGDGLGHLDGGAVFIPLTAPGDLVAPAQVVRRRGVHFGEAGRIVDPSPARVDPPCPWFGPCGGCQWMHMDYGSQLLWKEDVVRQALRGIGGFEGVDPVITHGAPSQYRYRYRARLHIRKGEAGFFRRGSHRIVPWERCLILPEEMSTAAACLRPMLRGGRYRRAVASCEIGLSPVDRSLSLNWILAGGGRSEGAALAAAAKGRLWPEGFRLACQSVRTTGGKILFSTGRGLPLEVRKVAMRASPGTFFQVNPAINDLLVERVLAHLASAGAASVVDLYCGNGNFALSAAAAGMEAVGVESSDAAVKDAAAEAGARCRIVRQDAVDYLKGAGTRRDALIVDPPRRGLLPEAARLLTERRFPTLVYVSCEPSTLARDLVLLTQGGYAVRSMEIFDMFPQTSLAEVLVVLKG